MNDAKTVIKKKYKLKKHARGKGLHKISELMKEMNKKEDNKIEPDVHKRGGKNEINLAAVNVRGYSNNQTAIEELMNK